LQLDCYNLTPYHYATPKVGHLPLVKCPASPAPSQTPPPSHSLPWLQLTLNCTRQCYSLPRPSVIHSLGSSVSDYITNLIFTVDSNLTLSRHVSSVCKSAYYSIKALRHIRPVLTCDMATAVAASLTQTRLDYANSLLIGTSGSNISKLQRVQNCLARVVLQDNYNGAISLLSELHQLPVNKRINFKIATLAYQSLFLFSPLFCLRY